MDALELGAGGGARGDGAAAGGQPGAGEGALDGGQALGALRMLARRLVGAEALVGDKAGSHVAAI